MQDLLLPRILPMTDLPLPAESKWAALTQRRTATKESELPSAAYPGSHQLNIFNQTLSKLILPSP